MYIINSENLRKLTPYINQHILLRDKAELYKDNYYDFDNHFDKFFILGSDD